MRFDASLLDDIRSRISVSDVVGRRVKLKRQGREYIGLSPFKGEKTPSFTVNDQKGFYHCFASGEHGDIFTFVMKTEGLSFPEAVERLAGEAGVPMPIASPDVAEKLEVKGRLHDVMRASTEFFQEELKSAAGRKAREYLDRRGVPVDMQDQFQIGYAPPGRTVLKEKLLAAGFVSEDIEATGMVIFGEDITVSYDRFRDRIMFPITDLKERVIAFGGRALDPSQPAKYMNSPETQLFHKGHVLYNAASARQGAYESGTVIAVEGYMDVVALFGAGIKNAVAPLGTALTDSQLQLLWRMGREPVMCFDGDDAGRKAAYRAVETALPLLKPGYSLRFAFLPDGQDPDDLVRLEGRSAFDDVVKKARPLADVLFNKEWEAGEWSTPERRADLEQTLRALVRRIGDGSVRAHYESDLKERLNKLWSPKGREFNGPQNFGRGSNGGKAQRFSQGYRSERTAGKGWAGRHRQGGGHQVRGGERTASLTSSALVRGERSRVNAREALILKTILNHPWLVDDHSEEIASLEFETRALGQLRDSVLQIHILQNLLDRETLHTQLSHAGQDSILVQMERAITHKSDRFAEPNASRMDVEAGWRHIYGLHRKMFDLKRELEVAERNYLAEASEENFVRLKQINNDLMSAEGLEPARDEQVGGVSE